jgi:hypothetical protein
MCTRSTTREQQDLALRSAKLFAFSASGNWMLRSPLHHAFLTRAITITSSYTVVYQCDAPRPQLTIKQRLGRLRVRVAPPGLPPVRPQGQSATVTAAHHTRIPFRHGSEHGDDPVLVTSPFLNLRTSASSGSLRAAL